MKVEKFVIEFSSVLRLNFDDSYERLDDLQDT